MPIIFVVRVTVDLSAIPGYGPLRAGASDYANVDGVWIPVDPLARARVDIIAVDFPSLAQPPTNYYAIFVVLDIENGERDF
ncbi:hypothetical protein AURDEDRAFT_176971 [Auricularia subglabra TFB-10046 SS5]|uniref:Uncharacterized protein n=1 Tax=Auricularia subglabra (strain TFB-10046 / SS5) TaxID=717982 RepID=J0WQ37_AURST|nr:hypothetical protein AURDEDRAFT_176971 [Auricularia subglabra TFB-10046 SS5]